MHDLPPEVEALLARARSGQVEPDLRTRERVKQGVAAAIATGALASSAVHVSAQAAGKSWLAGSLAAKITGVTLLGAVAAGSVVAPTLIDKPSASAPAHRVRKVPRLPQPAARGHEPSALETNELGAPAAAALGAGIAAPVVSGSASAPSATGAATEVQSVGGPEASLDPALEGVLRAARSLPPTGSLAAELRLLDQASQALARGDPSSARTLLRQHRARFKRPLLVEERDGLELIARCQLDAAGARGDARAFLARSAHSVLGAGVARACWRAR